MAKKYYWLKLKQDFFTSRAMKKLRKIAGGDTYTIIYLKLQLLSLKDDGILFYEGIEPTFSEEMALALDEDVENVQATLIFLENAGLINKQSDTEYILSEVPYLIGGESESAERMRAKRARDKEDVPKLESKTDAERQRAFRAKKHCEGQPHIPILDDHSNRKRYGGNYYIVLKRDQCKCRICGSIENICVHHIDGYDEYNPQNNAADKMITLCRSCHIKVHRREGFDISEEILEDIGYFDSNVTKSVTESDAYVRTSDTEKRREEIDIKEEIDTEREKNKKRGEENHRTFFVRCADYGFKGYQEENED